MKKRKTDKKAHHVVPITYLKRFADESGKVFAYRKDAVDRPLHLPPKALGFINQFYSQPRPGGGWDHNTLEDFFDVEVERGWTPIVERIQKKQAIDIWKLEHLFVFISVLHARVPAARDAVELALAKMVKRDFHLMNDSGFFPPPPTALKGKLDQIQVAIDPHKSIHAMKGLIEMMGVINNLMGFRILYNDTNVPFLTSDNPVVFFDPSMSDRDLRPYFVHPDGPIEMFVPIDSWNIIHGHTDFKRAFSKDGLIYEGSSEDKAISRINRHIAEFGYQFVFSSSEIHEPLVKSYAAHSPTIDEGPFYEVEDDLIVTRMVFGQRPKKVKWEND